MSFIVRVRDASRYNRYLVSVRKLLEARLCAESRRHFDVKILVSTPYDAANSTETVAFLPTFLCPRILSAKSLPDDLSLDLIH